MGFSLAEMQAEIGADLRPFDRALATVHARLGLLARSRVNLPGGGIAALVGIGGAVLGIQRVVRAASDLQESTNKARVVFGENFGIITSEVDALAEKFGVVRSESLDAMANLGQFALGMGKGGAEAANFAARMTKLAIDMKSFNNASIRTFQEAMIKVQSGLAGETEPLARLGVDLHEGTVKQYAWAKGIVTAGKQLTEQEKVMARAALMEERLGKVSGDLARTIGDYANASEAARGRQENLAADIGKSLLPAFTALRNLQNQVLIDITRSVDGSVSKLDQFTKAVEVTADIGGTLWYNLGDIFERTGTMIGGKVLYAIEYIGHFGNVIGDFVGWFGEAWPTVFEDAFNAALAVMSNFAANAKNLMDEIYNYIKSGFQDPIEIKFKPLLEGFESQVPEFRIRDFHPSSVDNQIDEIDRRMAKNAERRAAIPGLAPPAAVAGGVVPAIGGVPRKLNIGLTDIEGYQKELQEAALRAGNRGNIEEDQLAAAQETNKKLDDIKKTLADSKGTKATAVYK